VSVLDAPLRRVAGTLVERFGTAASVLQITPGSYNPATGGATDSTGTVTCRAVLREIANREVFGLAQLGDQVALVAATAFTTAPQPKDSVVIGTQTYQVVEVRPLRTGDQAAAFDLVLRGPASVVV